MEKQICFKTQFINFAKENNCDQVKILFTKNPKLVSCTDIWNFTALTRAAESGHTEICEFLVENGANVNHETIDKWTALTYAARNGHTETCEFLVENGANVNHEKIYKDTALLLAAYNGHTETCKLLVDNGANVNHEKIDKKSALILAAYNGHTAICKLLVENGANVNHETIDKDTALTKAAEAGHTETCKLLVENGAKVNHATINKKSALIIATRKGHSEIINLLKNSISSTSSNLSDTSDYSQAANVRNKLIHSEIKEKSLNSTPVIAPISSPFMRTLIQESPNVNPIPVTVGQAQGRSILSFLSKNNSQLLPTISANVPAVVIRSNDSVKCDCENDDESSCSTSETGTEICNEFANAELELIDKEESSDEDWDAACDSVEVDELNTSSQMKNQKNNLNILSYDTDLSSIILSLSDIKEMTQKIQKEYVTKDSINLLQADIVRGIVKNSGDQTHQTIKKLINVETKSAVESVISTKVWKNAMISQISTSMQTDIAPIIATHVNTSVKDTVKASLTSTFRGAFENSLLPAFQAGADRMLAQIQKAVDTGMEGLIEQGRISQQISTDATAELQEEVKSLKSTVSSLDLMVEKLINANNESNLKLENMIYELSKSYEKFENQSNYVANSDPISLLEKGLISEAVECALEKKNIHILVKLLEKITHSQMSIKCNILSQLCVAQQLAFNLASSEPEDGYSKRLSWLKSLIMILLSPPKDPNSSDHMQQLLSLIYSYLITVSVRLTQKLADCTENHEDSHEIASIIIDIKMLTAIVSKNISSTPI